MRRRDLVSAGAGAAALLVAILALGGVPRWALGVVGALVAVALVAQLPARRTLVERSPLLVLLLVAIGLTAMQAVPLPAGVAAALAPVPHDLVADSLALTGDADAWRPLSVDPPNTWRALWTLTILLGVAVLALRAAASERGRYGLLAAVAGVATLAAAIVGVHALVGARALYGVYAPAQASGRLLGPLLGTNQLGSLMAAGTLAGLGLALHARQPAWRRGAWVLAALACLAVLLATYSRGAALAVALGGVVLVAVVVMQRALGAGAGGGEGRAPLTTTIPIAVVVACAIALVVQLGGGGTAGELGATTLGELDRPGTKYDAWRAATTLIAEAPWAGVGRGGFEPAFTRVYPPSASGTFSHLENEYLQAVVDWGVPGAALLALAGGWLLVAMLRRWRGGPLEAGALAAACAIAVQSVVDFAIELPGMAIVAVVLAAIASHVAVRKPATPAPRWRRLPLPIAIVLGAVLVLPPWGRGLVEDQRVVAGAPPLADALAALRRHPLDYLAAGQAALAAARERDPRALPLLDHALTLHPTHPGLHRAGARLLVRAGHVDQGAREYAQALRGVPAPAPVVAELLRVLPDDAARLRALPTSRRDVRPLVAALVAAGRDDLALAYLEAVVAARPAEAALAERLLALAAQQGNATAQLRAAQALAAREPTLARRLVLARLLAGAGDHASIVTLLADVATAGGDPRARAAAWHLRCDAARRVGELALARACLDGLAASDVVTTSVQAQVDATRAHVARDEATAKRAAGSAAP